MRLYATMFVVTVLVLSMLPPHLLQCACSQPITNVKIKKEIIFKPGYVVANTTITVLNGSLNVLSYKIGEDVKSLLYVAVFAGDEVIEAKINWNGFYIVLPRDYKTFNLIEVYNVTMDYENDTVKIRFPLTITPREASGDAYIKVESPASNFAINYPPYFNKTALGAIANLTAVKPGTVDVFSISFYQSDLFWVKPVSLNRTVILEGYDEAVFVEEYIFENMLDSKSERVTLTLPLNATVKSVEGSTGRYTGRGGDGSYYRWLEKNHTMLTITFRSPLFRRGERIYVKVTYSIPVKAKDNTIIVPVYHSSGLLLENYRVLIKIAGEATLKDIVPKSIEVEGYYTVFELRSLGILISEKPYNPNIEINAIINPSFKLKPYILLGLFAFVLALVGIVFVRKTKTIEIKTEEIIKKEVAPETINKAADLYAQKIRLYENLATLKIKRLNDEISRRAYKQRLARIRSQIKNLNQKIDYTKASIKEISKKTYEFLNQIDHEYGILESKIGELDRIEASYRRGELSKKAYREKIAAEKEEIDNVIAKIYGKITLLKTE